MNIALRGLSSEQARQLIADGGNVSIDLMAEVATVKLGKKSKAVISDAAAKPGYLFDVTAAVAEVSEPEKTKPAK